MHIGFICLPLTGHLTPMMALARAVHREGHRVTFFGLLDSQLMIETAGLPFIPLCENQYPFGSVQSLWEPISKLHGLSAMKYWAERIHPAFLEHSLQALPPALVSANIDGLVIDAALAFIELAAISAGTPFAQTWLVLNFDASGTTPPNLFDWPFQPAPEARVKNLEGVQNVFDVFITPSLPVAKGFVEKMELATDLSDPTSTLSGLAVISQTPEIFDYPNIPWFPQFAYTGPFIDQEMRALIPFDWTLLDGRPLIYASLGTLTNGLIEIHKAILGAAASLAAYQFVFSIGSAVEQDDIVPIPDNVILVTSAPQLDLLHRAVLCITHGGLNTVLEALSAGVPMIAIPVAYDQPGNAARIAYHGVGEFIRLEDLSAASLAESLHKVLTKPVYADHARHFKSVLAGINGLETAAKLIIKAFHQPTSPVL